VVVSDLARDLIAKCISVEVEKRITAEEALHHTWITEIRHPPDTDEVLEEGRPITKRKRMEEEEEARSPSKRTKRGP
jgi:serine/threonine protein kinase